MYIPDPIELAEMRADRMIYELNMRDGMFDCPGCGKRSALDSASSDSPAPDAPPICCECAEKRWGSVM